MAQSFPDLKDQKLSTKEYVLLLANLTGYQYTFASAANLRWGKDGKVKTAEEGKSFTQIMPETSDDGFFDWYCDRREDYQFFKSKSRATLQFIYYWTEWKNTAK